MKYLRQVAPRSWIFCICATQWTASLLALAIAPWSQQLMLIISVWGGLFFCLGLFAEIGVRTGRWGFVKAGW